MELTDKLRELRGAVEANNVDNPIWVCNKATIIADEIEREIAERYMLLPVDAEGVPIRVGDKMEREGQQFIVCAIAPAVIHSWAAGRKLGEGLTTVGYRPEDCRHVKLRTIEDVLNDLMNDDQWDEDGPYEETKRRIVAKYADELRNMGVGE